MLHREPLLVTFVKWIDRIPMPPPPKKRGRGRPKVYSDRLILKALIIMVIRRLYTAYSLLAFLDQDTDLTQALRAQLTNEQGRFPSRRTWERRLATLPDNLPGLIGCLGRHLADLIQPWGDGGRAAALDSTALRANGGVWHKKHREAGIVPHSSIDTDAHWSKSGHHDLCMPKGVGEWLRLDALPQVRPGISLWLGNILLTQTHAHPTNLVIHWRKGEKTPWFLATNMLCPRSALRLYQRRMWLEEMFGDMKGHGFDLEDTHLRHFLRLSRLTLAVCLLYTWLVAIGEHVLATHQADEVDRNDRRDLSIFRIGWDFIIRRLEFGDPVPILFVPNFCLVSGG